MERHQERFLVAAEYKEIEGTRRGRDIWSQNAKKSRLDAGCCII
jgi:hypothetical protein